jgi:curved DNA-binding protein CbpA
MANFYQILGIDRSADSTTLRAAYKKMALLYHPDRNPGNKEAEEMFKVINEAYHVLSDSLKRSRYDAGLYGSSTSTSTQTEQYWRDIQRQQYARWYARQQTSRYRFDREYFRIQGLAFLTFFIIASFCFGLIQTVNYIYALKQAETDRQNQKLVMHVNTLFNSGHVDEAFATLKKLRNEFPMEYRFYYTHDSLISAVRDRAENEFREHNYSTSLHFLEILQKQESPPRLETLRKLAVCEYQTGDFVNALQSLKHIYNQQPWNLELLYQIGMINQVNLEDDEQALYYFTLGKKIFKENLTRIYGSAFEIVMDPADAPGIYYEIFEARARTNLKLKHYYEAQTDCNWGIFLRPQKPVCYAYRAQAKASQNIQQGVCNDLAMAKKLGAENIDDLQRAYCR